MTGQPQLLEFSVHSPDGAKNDTSPVSTSQPVEHSATAPRSLGDFMLGWIKLHRELQTAARFKDSEWVHIWVFILLNATHKPFKMVFGGSVVELKPGQLITSRKSIAEKTGISESKVERVLKMMKIEQQIEQQTSSLSRLITVLNWGWYQEIEQQIEQRSNNDRTTTEQRSNTNKKYKNIKKVKNSPHDVVIPEELKTEEFTRVWKKWIDHLIEKKTNPTTHAIEGQLKKCQEIGINRAIAMVQYSTLRNWQGLYEEKQSQMDGRPKPSTPQTGSIFECL